MDSPLVTILMPVYNAELFLKRAMDSILNQTYKNIEFLIINDGSTDNSLAIIKSYLDTRIVLLENTKNFGLIYSLNIGMEKATGKYIARMDADDISHKDRIQKQCDYMEANTYVGILGTFIQKENKFKLYAQPNLNSNELKTRLIFTNIFNHPTIMFRNSFVKEKKISYNQEFKHAEDYNLWLGIINETEFAILPEYLLFYENHPDQISVAFDKEQKAALSKTHHQFFSSINLNANAEELEIHRRLFYQDYIFTETFLEEVEKWILKIIENKALQKILGIKALTKTAAVVWFEVCTHFATNNVNSTRKYYSSSLCNSNAIALKSRILFNLKKYLKS